MELIEHCEKCDRCLILESARDVLTESGESFEKIFMAITDEQIECANTYVNEEVEARADAMKDEFAEAEAQENFCN